jgi:hypothetical protein
MKYFLRFLFLVFVLFSSQLLAQTRIGIRAGLNMSNVNQKYENEDDERATKCKSGFQLGIDLEIKLAKSFSLQPGLIFSSKGYAINLEDELFFASSVEGYYKVILNYFEIPINLVYRINNFQVYTGPFIGFGVGGRYKWDYTYVIDHDNSNYSSAGENGMKPVFGSVTVNNLNTERPFNALDYGINFSVGYELGKIHFNMGYSFSCSNLSVKYTDYPKFDPKSEKKLNRNLFLSTSYFFGK